MTDTTNGGAEPAAAAAEAAALVADGSSAAAAALAAASAGGAAAALAPGDRTCGVCGEAGHNRRTCPRVAHSEGAKVQSGEEAEKAKAALSMAGFAPAAGSNAQHSLVQAFAVATGLMHNPAAAAYRNGPDMMLQGLPGRVLPVSVGPPGADGKVGEGAEGGGGSKELEEATTRRDKAEGAASKAEEEAALAESKLEAARKRKAEAELKLQEVEAKA